MKNKLLSHINSLRDSALRVTCETLFDYDKFFVCPASLSFHHAYEGGLLAHTIEVCDIALSMHAGSHGRKDLTFDESRDILLTSALWHDLMKIEEYRFFWDWPANTVGQRLLAVPGKDESGLQKFWSHTDYGKHIGHICGSAMEFSATAGPLGVGSKVIREVSHCLLAHHGRREWGSPVEPQTLEALILHQADMLSAKFGATKEVSP